MLNNVGLAIKNVDGLREDPQELLYSLEFKKKSIPKDNSSMYERIKLDEWIYALSKILGRL